MPALDSVSALVFAIPSWMPEVEVEVEVEVEAEAAADIGMPAAAEELIGNSIPAATAAIPITITVVRRLTALHLIATLITAIRFAATGFTPAGFADIHLATVDASPINEPFFA
ncbi:MAG: hypothetical protein ACTHXA_06095 [Gulosibacter sp.]|uniref:hypothetical protein n=1 Tax=Gulosibacter sp. TaxID=2817531 RepID=UPI003F8DEF14